MEWVDFLIQQQRSQPYDLITEMEDGFLDLYSTEYSLTFAHLKHISKMKTTSQCSQDTCPNGHKDHFLSEFAVANSEEANAASIEAKFKGYMSKCKAKFPPSDFLGHTNYSIDYGNKTPANDSAVRRYCNGNRVYKPCIFMSKNPWIIWFSIENISAVEAVNLPQELHINQKQFMLGGITFHSQDHYTGAFMWNNKLLSYDGRNNKKPYMALDTNLLHHKKAISAVYFCARIN